MNTRRVIVPIISTVVFAASCLAAEPFQIPGERDRAVVGTWIMVLMGEGEDLKAVPVEKATEFILRADGSGTLREGLKEKAILRIAEIAEIAEGPRGLATTFVELQRVTSNIAPEWSLSVGKWIRKQRLSVRSPSHLLKPSFNPHFRALRHRNQTKIYPSTCSSTRVVASPRTLPEPSAQKG